MKLGSMSLPETQMFEVISELIKIILQNKELFLTLYYTKLLENKKSCREKKTKNVGSPPQLKIHERKYNFIEEEEEEFFLPKNCHFQARKNFEEKNLNFAFVDEEEILIELSTGIHCFGKVKNNGIGKKSTKSERDEKKLQGIIKRASTLEDEEEYSNDDEEDDDDDEEEEEYEEDEVDDEEAEDEEEEENESEFSHGEEETEKPEKRRRGRPKKVKTEEKPVRKIARKKNVSNSKELESKLKTYFYILENCVEWKEERIGAKKKILGNFLGKKIKETETPTTPTTPSTPSIIQKLSATAPQTSPLPPPQSIPTVQPVQQQQQPMMKEQPIFQTSSIPSTSGGYKIPKKKTTPTTPIDKQTTQQISSPIPPDIATHYPKEDLIQWCKHHMYPSPMFKEIKRSQEGVVVGVILPHLNNLLFSDAIFSPNLEISENRACMKAIEYMWSVRQQQQQQQEFNSNVDRRFDSSDQWRQQNRGGYGGGQNQQNYYNQNRYYDDKPNSGGYRY